MKALQYKHISMTLARMNQKSPALFAAIMTVFMILGTAHAATPEPAVVFLVRHAEKAGDDRDPGLSKAGQARAGELAEMLADAGITAIYSSDYRRARDTAQPLATQLGLEIMIYDPQQLETLAQILRTSAGRSLVVGHSNTTPELVELLGGEPGPAIDEAKEHDRFYSLTLLKGETVSTVLLRYWEH
jgi:broad specificity phosphatase PhoE